MSGVVNGGPESRLVRALWSVVLWLFCFVVMWLVLLFFFGSVLWGCLRVVWELGECCVV